MHKVLSATANDDYTLDLKFDDADVVTPGDLVAMQRELARKRDALQNGLLEVPPTVADVSAIIDFAQSIRLIC